MIHAIAAVAATKRSAQSDRRSRAGRPSQNHLPPRARRTTQARSSSMTPSIAVSSRTPGLLEQRGVRR